MLSAMGVAVAIDAEHEEVDDREFGDDLPDVVHLLTASKPRTSGEWMSILACALPRCWNIASKSGLRMRWSCLIILGDDPHPHRDPPDFRRRVGRGATFSSSGSGCM